MAGDIPGQGDEKDPLAGAQLVAARQALAGDDQEHHANKGDPEQAGAPPQQAKGERVGWHRLLLAGRGPWRQGKNG